MLNQKKHNSTVILKCKKWLTYPSKDLLSIFIYASLQSHVFGVQNNVFDIRQAWQAARNYNAEYAVATFEKEAAYEKIPQGLALLLPQINAASTYTHTFSVPEFGAAIPNNTSLNISQVLFDLSKTIAYKKTKVLAAQAGTQLSSSEQKLMSELLFNYFNGLQSLETLAATQASKKFYEFQLSEAKEKAQLGIGSMIEVDEAQAGFDGAVAKEISDQSAIDNYRTQMQNLTGIKDSNPLAIKNILALTPYSASNIDDLLRQALAVSPQIKSAVQSVEISELEIQEKKALHMPTIYITGAYTSDNNRANFSSNSSNTSHASIVLSMPIFSGGGSQAQVKEAWLKKAAAKSKLEATRRQLTQELNKTVLSINSGSSLIKAGERLVASSKGKLDMTKIGVTLGVRNNLDLLQAEQTHYEARSTLAKYRHDYLISHVQLAQISGTLNEQFIDKLNALIIH